MITMALLGLPAADRLVQQHLFSWVPAGSFEVSAGLRIDPLSLTFVLLVTFVGTLIHIYSVAYMAQDTDRRRFFARSEERRVGKECRCVWATRGGKRELTRRRSCYV